MGSGSCCAAALNSPPLLFLLLQILDEALKEEFKKEEEKKDDVGQHFNETAASDEVRCVSASHPVRLACVAGTLRGG